MAKASCPIHNNGKITADDLKRLVEWHIKYSLSKQVSEAHKSHLFTALALAIRDLCIDQMMLTAKRHKKAKKRVYYLSLEYNNYYNH